MQFHPPLEKMRITQPFGENYLPLYKELGMDGHNGLDLRAPTGTEVYAVADGRVYNQTVNSKVGYGKFVRLFIKNDDYTGYECVYAHLKKVIKTGKVKKGDLIALANNTGYSTGAHLHFGVRPVHWEKSGAGPHRFDLDNGYKGYIDPRQFFDKEVFNLPVDNGYYVDGVSVLEFAPAFLYFLRSQKRLPTFREYRALRFGRWPLREVLDAAFFPIWSEMTYMEAKKRKLVK